VAEFFVATVETDAGAAAAVVTDEAVHPLLDAPGVAGMLESWDAWLERIDRLVEHDGLDPGIPVGEARLLAPLPRPANLYMAGANYADHAREMRGLGSSDPVPRPPEGPFVFLKPTTSVVGDRAPIRIGPGCHEVDWEVELAVVIGRPARRVAAADALSHVAGYTIANDVSARDRFRRGEDAEPPMTFDWLAQKGWEASCPLGPWLLPARDCPDPGDLALSLTVNGELEQCSRTSEMIFSIEEQIAYLSGIVPLVPGDVICTGTCAGVGMAKGRFLSPGDTVVAEIEGIGRLENPVEEG
jgi:2,4-didehydro-3-deoxy-L-rhamnonate hydrolase